MNRTSAHQALCAGLGGASLAFLPTTALGLSLDELPGQLLSLPFAPFVVGVLGGAAVAGGVYGITVKIAEMAGGSHPKKPASKRARASHAVDVPVAASLYKPRHMSPQDFEKSGVIRVQPAQAYSESQRADTGRHFKSSIMNRISAEMMRDIPIIQRADGTVGNLGSSWWLRNIEEKTVSYDAGWQEDEQSIESLMRDKNRVTPQSITHRVAQIDEGLYPEKRTSDDLDRSDVWASALEALDEKLEGSKKPAYTITASFTDTVGGYDSLDEPDGLEGNTGFIPFRVPAGHPEVVDTESYINHLVSEEFSHNPSDVARKSSRHYLRVIEGGTHNLKAGKTGTQVYVGKHFAPMPKAAEA